MLLCQLIQSRLLFVLTSGQEVTPPSHGELVLPLLHGLGGGVLGRGDTRLTLRGQFMYHNYPHTLHYHVCYYLTAVVIGGMRLWSL